MRRIFKVLASAAAIVSASTAAHAVSILPGSSINLNGFVIGSGGADLGSSTSLDFNEQNGVASPGVAGVVSGYGSGSGSFLGIACATGTCGAIKDISSFVVGAQSIADFVTLSGGNNVNPIRFSLTDIASISSPDPQILTFTANGVIDFLGYDSTPGRFIFTAQGGQVTSFSGTTLATAAVPEPGTWMMMLVGFGALGFVMRKKRSTFDTGRRLTASAI